MTNILLILLLVFGCSENTQTNDDQWVCIAGDTEYHHTGSGGFDFGGGGMDIVLPPMRYDTYSECEEDCPIGLELTTSEFPDGGSGEYFECIEE